MEPMGGIEPPTHTLRNTGNPELQRTIQKQIIKKQLLKK